MFIVLFFSDGRKTFALLVFAEALLRFSSSATCQDLPSEDLKLPGYTKISLSMSDKLGISKLLHGTSLLLNMFGIVFSPSILLKWLFMKIRFFRIPTILQCSEANIYYFAPESQVIEIGSEHLTWIDLGRPPIPLEKHPLVFPIFVLESIP